MFTLVVMAAGVGRRFGGDKQLIEVGPGGETFLDYAIAAAVRAGATKDKKTKLKSPSSVLSTAEAISVLFNSAILAQHFGDGSVGPRELSRSLMGAVAKESEDDLKAIREYCETVAKGRRGLWKDFYSAARLQLRG